MRRATTAVVLLLWGTLGAPGLGAEQNKDLIRAVDALEKALDAEQNLRPETREALRSLARALREDEEEEAAAPAAVRDIVPAAPGRPGPLKLDSSLANLDLKGDFRFRLENNSGRRGKEDQFRPRIRFRLGATWKLNDTMTVGSRIITGDPDDPNSPHQTLGEVFNSKTISLDRAFFAWKPSERFWTRAGKFGNPFQIPPIYSDIVWDQDVQPEGLAVGTGWSNGNGFRFDLTAGEYLILEQSNGPEASMSAAQAAFRWSRQRIEGGTALSFYSYANLEPGGNPVILRGDNAGNAVVDDDGDGQADRYVSDFRILDLFGWVRFLQWAQPLTFSGQVIHNTGANISGDTGYAAAVAVGRQKEAHDWLVYYQYAVVEQDAVFSAFAEDDMLLQTNYRSHFLGFKYLVTDAFGLHLYASTVRMDEPPAGVAPDWQTRLRLDLNYSF